jgi:LmbE family N-acetylglucosaminyl deacetylase
VTQEAPRSRSLLVVTAHPDDETFIFGGTLARYASEGVEVHLAVGCLDDRDSGSIRRAELACASEALGVTSSSILEYERPSGHGDLSESRVGQFAERVREVIERIGPQVVVTFDSTGGNAELDHILMGRATRAAFESAVGQTNTAEGTAPEKLYVAHFGKRLLRFGANVLRVVPGRDPRRFGPDKTIDLVTALADSPSATTFVDVRAYFETRRRAVACHQSQLAHAPWFLRRYELLPARVRAAVFPRELYARVWPPPSPGLRETDLFTDG